MAYPKIQIKRGTTTPLVSDFIAGELALNTTANTLYAQNGTVIAATVLAGSGSTFAISNVTPSVTYLGVVGYTATMTSSLSNSGVAVGDILRGTNGVGGDLGQFPTTQCIVTAISASPFQTLTFWSSSTPTAGVVTAVTKTSPLKWVGAEIENTLTSTNFNKLTTQAGIATYIGNTSLPLGGGTLTGALNLKNGTSAGELSFYEPSASGSNFIKLKAPSAVTTDTTLTLPDGPPGTNGYLLKSDTNGVLGWVAPTPATSIGATDDTSTGTALPIVFISGSTLKTTSSKLNFIPTTGVLTSTALSATDGTNTTTLNGTSLGISGGTSFNLINANATTVNFAGAATTLSIGAATGTTTVNNNTVITGNLTTTGNTVHNGNFTVAGTQTYLNTTVMTVTDKNIELGFGTGTTGSSFSSGALTTVPSFSTFSAKLSQALGTLWKLTFTSGTVPVGVRVGTTLAQATITAGNAGYIGSSATVVSVTPTEIYYTAGGTPVATIGTTTFTNSTGNLTVTNEFTGVVSVTGTDTANMVVGSAITVISGTALNTPAVAQINSATSLTIVVRTSITVSAATVFSTGSASDITADGGGITVKSTTNSVNTDKTLTWVSSTKNWTFNQGLETSAVTDYPGLTVNTTSTNIISGLILSNINTGGGQICPAIEFKGGASAALMSTKGFILVTSGGDFQFQPTSRGNTKFSVDSSGVVGDCTIDCGSY